METTRGFGEVAPETAIRVNGRETTWAEYSCRLSARQIDRISHALDQSGRAVARDGSSIEVVC